MRLSDLADRSSQPAFVASREAVELLFGPEHPYGESLLGTPAGTLRARATVRSGVATSVAFLNVPSWAVLDLEVEDDRPDRCLRPAVA